MSVLGECRDINGLSVKHGLMYMAGPGECHQCVCESGVPKNCQDVMCHQPQNCSTFRKGARCCDFVCLDDLPSGKNDVVNMEGDFGLRLIASVITAILSFSLLLFLVHRLRQRKIRSGRQNRQLNEDERSLGSIGYITGSLGYLPGAMERYEEPTAHFPHYPLWKPPGNYFPRGEAPPPYEEAIAATRAEALAAAMASGNLHSNPSNFGREALLGMNYNTYATGNLLTGAAHRTIPINLATSASFTLQPERFDDNPSNGGSSCLSVAAGTVSVTATVTGPPMARSDLIHSEMTHIRHGGESSSRSSTLRRSDITTRADIGLRGDSSLRLDGARRSEVGHRADAYQWTETPHRLEAGHRPDVALCLDGANHRSDASHKLDSGHRLDNVQGTDLNHHSDIHQTDGNCRPELPHRIDSIHLHDGSLSNAQVDTNERVRLQSEPHNRHEFSHRELYYRDGLWRQDVGNLSSYQRGEERRLPSTPLPENSHSLPPHHSHGLHQVHSFGQTLHSHSFGRHQAAVPLQESPFSLPSHDADQKERIGCPAKVLISQLPNIPKSGTGKYEDSIHSASSDGSHLHTATLRRGKQVNVGSAGHGTLRRNPVPVATPTPKLTVPQAILSDFASLPSNSLSGSSAINIPPTISPSEAHNGLGLSSASPTLTVVTKLASTPSRCTCHKASSPKCNCPGSCQSNARNSAVNESPLPQSSDLSLAQGSLDDNDDYRSECENCKSTHSSNYYLDAEDPEPEITMTLHRKPTDSNEENGNGYYRTSLTLPTRHRVMPLHGVGARENWFSSMPESSSEDESDV